MYVTLLVLITALEGGHAGLLSPPHCTAKDSEAWGPKSLQGRVETQKVFFPGQMNFKLSSWLFCSIAAFFFFFLLPRMERPTHTHNYRSNTSVNGGFVCF